MEYEPLQKALREAKTLHLQVNEAVCNEENIVKLEWLQKHVQLSLDEVCVLQIWKFSVSHVMALYAVI